MPNQYTDTITHGIRVMDYLDAHPGQTARQIHEGIKIQYMRVMQELAKLERSGKAQRVIPEGCRAARWYLAQEDQPDALLTVKQVVKAQWKPHHVRDPLDIAFFGEAA